MNHEISILQRRLIEYNLAKFEHAKDAIRELETVLNISQSSVYKRIQGVKLVTSDEISVLIKRFSISPEVLFPLPKDRIIFDFLPLREESKITGNYLSNVIQELEQVSANSDGKVTYLSTDLPFFYYFLHKEVAWFKLYLFEHNSSNKGISQLPKLSFSAIGREQELVFESVKTLYSKINSEEIWTSRVFKITVDQVKYFVEAKLFQYPEEALLLLDKLAETTDQLLEMINKNNKGLIVNQVTKGGTITLSYNDFNRFNPLIIASAKGMDNLYLTYDLPHYLYTTDIFFAKYTKEWIKRIKRKAFPLSANADIEQVLFFNEKKQYILAEKERIKQMLVKY